MITSCLPVQSVFSGFSQTTSDKYGYDQSVNSDNTRHDNGNDGFHYKFGPHH